MEEGVDEDNRSKSKHCWHVEPLRKNGLMIT